MSIHVAPAIAGYRLAAGSGRRTMDGRLFERLEALAPTRRDEPLSRHTTFGIGGPADLFVTVRNAEELRRAVIEARRAVARPFVLGAGSNILVGDGGVRGVVIDNQATATSIDPISDERRAALPDSARGGAARPSLVHAESGTPFATLARKLAREGYEGIEWACGIPGTLGGATVYNAGAYTGSLADALLSAKLLDEHGNVRELPTAALGMGYRTSALLRGGLGACVVLSVELVVRRGDGKALHKRIAEYDRQRLDAQPRGRNSGSTFKNPPGRQAWELVDAVGLRGERRGGARFSDKHCNFIENLGRATAADVAWLIGEAQRRVREQFGIELEREVAFVGEGF